MGKHLRAQRLGVVVGDDKPHIGSRPAVQHGVFARAGDYHVASQPQQRLKRHNKRQIGAALDFPVGEQRLVVDEPAAVFYFVGLGLHHRSDGDFLTLPHSKRLVVPEPERLHAQKAAADFKQTVDKAEVIGSREQQRVGIHRQRVLLGGERVVDGQQDAPARCGGICKNAVKIAVQRFQCVLHRLGRRRGGEDGVAVENHNKCPSRERIVGASIARPPFPVVNTFRESVARSIGGRSMTAPTIWFPILYYFNP